MSNYITASEVAKYILSLVDQNTGDVISNMKLQKLLYYCQGFHLAIKDTPLFDDKIVAWQYGPVIPEVYDEYKEYGAGSIPPVLNYEGDLPEEVRNLIDNVFNEYGQFSAWKLAEMTHNEYPWKNTSILSEIAVHKMRSYFSELVE